MILQLNYPVFCKIWRCDLSLIMCRCLSVVYMVFLNYLFRWWNEESIQNWERKPLYYTLNIVKNPVNSFWLHIFPRKISSVSVEYFSAICYDEKQAHIVCGVHLVIFSTSFQWKSINLLFHIFRQEIDCICKT